MSKKEEGSNHIYSHRTSIEQLLKCYGPYSSRECRKTDPNHVSVTNLEYSDRVSVSRHSEQRLRPRTCAACRACVTASLSSSVQEVKDATLPPLDRIHHLPYHPAKADRNRQKGRHKTKVADQLPRAEKLVSCNVKSSAGDRGSTPSCSSSPLSQLSGTKKPSSPALPALPQSGLLSVSSGCVSVHKTHSSNPELRKWIVEFGGDERAAFMARGLQKLQLAYEQGKAEMDQQTENRTRLSAH
ncbi:uncharacterized protein LOC142157897 [Mixophyes fleayi]|uniref:uncharacterized protein LOC142157897 n=1 Tax=Mixophyes fleayi TaxID=3061075 RepID=UPI003F4D8739